MAPLDTPAIRTSTAAMLAGVTTRSILRWIEDGTMTGEQCPRPTRSNGRRLEGVFEQPGRANIRHFLCYV